MWEGGKKSAEIKEGKKNQHKRAASIGRRKSHLLRRTPWPWNAGANERVELMQAQFDCQHILSFQGCQAHYEVREREVFEDRGTQFPTLLYPLQGFSRSFRDPIYNRKVQILSQTPRCSEPWFIFFVPPSAGELGKSK